MKCWGMMVNDLRVGRSEMSRRCGCSSSSDGISESEPGSNESCEEWRQGLAGAGPPERTVALSEYRHRNCDAADAKTD